MVQGYSQDVIVTIECNCDNHHCVSENIITSLKLEVKELNDKVKILMQVDTLTTALGLASNCTPTSTSASASIQSSSSQACIDAHTQECTNTDRPMFSITSEPRWSYAAVIGNRSGVQQMHQRIHQKMVSAVYIDLEKRKWANNVVMCSLTNDPSLDDRTVITGMILQEFGCQISVKSTRHLGKKIDGKTQNMLVLICVLSYL